VTRNLTVKVVCVLLAGLLWAQAAADQQVERVLELPLHLTGLPDSLVVRKRDAPASVWVRLESTKLQLLLHDVFGRGRGRVEVDLEAAGEGEFHHDISVREVVADGTPLAVESPTTLHLQIHRRVQREVPVRVVLDGQLESGLIFAGRPAVTPPQVLVSGPKPVVEGLDHVNTEPIKVSRRRRSFSETVTLARPDPDLELRPVEVDVTLGIDEIVERSFENLPISVLSDVFDSTRIYVEPRTAQVRLTGPARTMRALRPQEISVVLPIGDKEGGVYQIEPQVLVPDEILGIAVDPPSFQVIVDGGGRGADADR
jgi:hypothetical protein